MKPLGGSPFVPRHVYRGTGRALRGPTVTDVIIGGIRASTDRGTYLAWGTGWVGLRTCAANEILVAVDQACLCSSIDAQLAEDGGHVLLDGPRRDHEQTSYLAVGHALSHEAQHLDLPRRQSRELNAACRADPPYEVGEVLKRGRRQGSRHREITGTNSTNGPLQSLGPKVLRKVSHCPRGHRFHDLQLRRSHGEHDDSAFGESIGELPYYVDAGDSWQVEVEEHDFRLQRSSEGDRLLTGACLPDYCDIGCDQGLRHGMANKLVVIDEHDAEDSPVAQVGHP